MATTRILILEDDHILAHNLYENLIEMGYHNVVVKHDPAELILNMDKYHVDVGLIDIHLSNDAINGIDVAKQLNRFYGTSIIYLTSYTSGKLRDQAMKTLPSAYLVKPVDRAQLEASINLEQLRMQNIDSQKKFEFHRENEYVHVRVKNKYQRILANDIIYLKGDGSYTKLYTNDNMYTLSMSIKGVLSNLSRDQFIRCHRSYVVNLDKLLSYDSKYLYVYVSEESVSIPISRQCKPLVKSKLKS